VHDSGSQATSPTGPEHRKSTALAMELPRSGQSTSSQAISDGPFAMSAFIAFLFIHLSVEFLAMDLTLCICYRGHAVEIED
jgi:hypothetical protein